jgi:hypothetical protein
MIVTDSILSMDPILLKKYPAYDIWDPEKKSKE